jgi:hypothetical protein
MRVLPGLLVVLCACNGEGSGGTPALVYGLSAGPGFEVDTDTACRCALDRRAAAPSYDCESSELPAGAALCQRGDGVIYCAPEDQRLQTFTGDVACDPGFCVSLDGESCLVLCECLR